MNHPADRSAFESLRAAIPWLSACTLCFLASAKAEVEILPPEQHLNGAETLAQLGDLPERARRAGFLVFQDSDEKAEPIALGTWVGPDLGLTKSSQIDPEKDLWLATHHDQPRRLATLVTRNETLDLALVRWTSRPDETDAGIEPVRLPNEITPVEIGHWLVSTALEAKRPVMLGVVAAARRVVPSSGAMLGLELSEPDEDDRVSIVEISPGGPAHEAGLRRGDVLMRFNNKEVSDGRVLIDDMKKLRPGDWVELGTTRNGSSRITDHRVRLVSRSQIERFWHGEHWTDGGISPRSDDFPESIHHSTPVPAARMGGAVFDLEGRWLGLNIARFDRVTTFTLPVGAFRDWLEKHIDKVAKP